MDIAKHNMVEVGEDMLVAVSDVTYTMRDYILVSLICTSVIVLAAFLFLMILHLRVIMGRPKQNSTNWYKKPIVHLIGFIFLILIMVFTFFVLILVWK